MSDLHPALAFLRERLPTARPLGGDALLVELAGTPVEIFVAAPDSSRALFAAGPTRLSYRCRSELSPGARDSLRRLLLELVATLRAGRVGSVRDPLPAGGGWTAAAVSDDPSGWRDWVARGYRAVVESGGRDACFGLPACLDLRMRPPIEAPRDEMRRPPRRGPCAACGRARVCPAAGELAPDSLAPLRHADAVSAEVAALQTLAEAASVSPQRALEAYALLTAATGDRALAGALPLEFSVRLPLGERRPDRLRFVSYYPLVGSDAVREEIHRGRRAAARELAARWLTPSEVEALDAWLDCAARTQPATLGLSIGVELDAAALRLQVYAHPESNDDGRRFAATAAGAVTGTAERLPSSGGPPVLAGIALTAHRALSLKFYFHRPWAERADTGLLPDGLGALDDFNPGWGLAIQEHSGGARAGAEWVKWDFPVTAHFQEYRRFLAAFWRTTAAAGDAAPDWLAGERFSPWPTWASLGRGGWALYFHAR